MAVELGALAHQPLAQPGQAPALCLRAGKRAARRAPAATIKVAGVVNGQRCSPT